MPAANKTIGNVLCISAPRADMRPISFARILRNLLQLHRSKRQHFHSLPIYLGKSPGF